MRSVRGLTAFVNLILVLAASAARAEVGDDARGPAGRITEGTLFWRSAVQSTPVPAPTLATDVSIVVRGMVARASLRQEFTNPSSAWAEGIYVFPLPEDAAVDHLRMKVPGPRSSRHIATPISGFSGTSIRGS
jgi:Ca-activated chloride channel family protein